MRDKFVDDIENNVQVGDANWIEWWGGLRAGPFNVGCFSLPDPNDPNYCPVPIPGITEGGDGRVADLGPDPANDGNIDYINGMVTPPIPSGGNVPDPGVDQTPPPINPKDTPAPPQKFTPLPPNEENPEDFDPHLDDSVPTDGEGPGGPDPGKENLKDDDPIM